MNRNRHMQYRRSIYKKHRIRVIIITSAVVLALLAILFLIIGNILFDKANEDENESLQTTAPQTNDSIPADSVRQIKATAISLESSLNSTLDSAKAGGFNAVSVMLNTSDGKLTHYSDIAKRLKYESFNDVKTSVSKLMESAKDRSLYVSGIYYVSAFSESDELARSVYIAELASVISESLLAGLDEVILLAPDITEEQCAEVTHLISEIRAFVPDAVIGFALPESLVESNNSNLIDDLARQISFLALDITKYGEADPTAFAEARITPMLYSLLRYKMRVMIPFFEESEKQSSIISTVESAGISNWQIVK
ncbi:MAG: hypothetical protein IKJ00_02570 [Clostridia bacterium]|nr:hypothetical protein [Clostridia bacterium]